MNDLQNQRWFRPLMLAAQNASPYAGSFLVAEKDMQDFKTRAAHKIVGWIDETPRIIWEDLSHESPQ